jgi:predicted RNase H-like nuclease
MLIISMPSMVHIGVDGCPEGWFAVRHDGDSTTADLYGSSEELWQENKHAEQILVDIPIGLPEDSRRKCDLETRDVLGCRSISVFFTPCRGVLETTDQGEMNQINKNVTGHGVQPPALSLMEKIREMDTLLDEFPAANDIIEESHPELCYYRFNDDTPMAYSKKSERGQRRRLRLLSNHIDNADKLFVKFSETYAGEGVNDDDILDAMVLAAAAAAETATLPAEPEVDAEGRPMQMVYPVLG